MSSRNPSQSGGGDDRGLATVLVCLACTALLLLTGITVYIGAAAVARRRAEAAADLAALAGAGWALRGPESACSRAADVVTANRASIVSCAVDGLDVLVQVRVSVKALGLTDTANARARAGPADTAPPR